MAATVELPLVLPHKLMLEPGSILIERYSYERASGGKSVQWVVHRVEKTGELANLIVCETRREAAEFVARGR